MILQGTPTSRVSLVGSIMLLNLTGLANRIDLAKGRAKTQRQQQQNYTQLLTNFATSLQLLFYYLAGH